MSSWYLVRFLFHVFISSFALQSFISSVSSAINTNSVSYNAWNWICVDSWLKISSYPTSSWLCCSNMLVSSQTSRTQTNPTILSLTNPKMKKTFVRFLYEQKHPPVSEQRKNSTIKPKGIPKYHFLQINLEDFSSRCWKCPPATLIRSSLF